MMVLDDVNLRLAIAIRLAGLALVGWSILQARHHPGVSGRGLVVTICLAAAAVCWLLWTARTNARRGPTTVEVYGLAAAGGFLVGAVPNSAASAFVFVAVAIAAIRGPHSRALQVLTSGVAAVALSILVYGGSGVGLAAYALGLVAASLAGSKRPGAQLRTEQAELLLAQSQRSHEEQLRSARLEESTRIAREIHDVLSHTLAGLTIQLEATSSLLEQGAPRDAILARVQRAHTLARDGLSETRRAVGALRGDPISAPAAIEALVADYRESAHATAELSIDGDPARLSGPVGEAVLRVVQEALTNVRKHAPGAAVWVTIHLGNEEVSVQIDNRPVGGGAPPRAHNLARSGGGYGLQGMRERAELLGGTLDAGATADGGWRVELRLPVPDAAAVTAQEGRR